MESFKKDQRKTLESIVSQVHKNKKLKQKVAYIIFTSFESTEWKATVKCSHREIWLGLALGIYGKNAKRARKEMIQFSAFADKTYLK